ncbi:MAG: formyltransferase family protein [Ectothiorhodospiraceae bacterium]
MASIAVFGYSRFTRRCVEGLISLGYRVKLFCPRSDRATFDQAMQGMSVPAAYCDTLDGPELHEAMTAFRPDFLLTIIFNHKVPDSVLEIPRHGALNVHPAPLPSFRTANAWFWPLREGVKRSEIAVHHMTAQWDRGNVLLRVPFDLHPLETQGTYTSRVIACAPALVRALDPMLRTPPLPAGEPQGEGQYYRAVRLADLFIDFHESATRVDALVRACNPNHGAQALFRSRNIEISEVTPVNGPPDEPGTLHVHDNRLVVSCNDGLLELRVVKDPEEGVFSGERFAHLYAVTSGETLRSISSLPGYRRFLE